MSLVKEIVVSPLYILAPFVKDKVSIGVWIYLWAFYFVPLLYISVFVPVPYCLDDQSTLNEINPEYSLEGLMLKMKLQYFGHVMQRADSFKKTLMLRKIESRRGRERQRIRWFYGITESMNMSLGVI